MHDVLSKCKLPAFKIFKKGNMFEARLYETAGFNITEIDFIKFAESLDELRQIKPPRMVIIPRAVADPDNIVEVWC